MSSVDFCGIQLVPYDLFAAENVRLCLVTVFVFYFQKLVVPMCFYFIEMYDGSLCNLSLFSLAILLYTSNL